MDLGIAIAALAIAAASLGGLIYFARAALQRADAAATAQAELAALKVTVANAATKTASDAEQAQEKRGDALEKEVNDEANPPGSGLDRLSKLAGIGAAPGGSGAGPGTSGP